MGRYHMFELEGYFPAESVEDLIDYALSEPMRFLDRFTIWEVPDEQLEKDDLDYLKELNLFVEGDLG